MQMGTLGAGNHYAEIQVVEEVFDADAARKMGIDKVRRPGPSLSCAVSPCTGANRVLPRCSWRTGCPTCDVVRLWLQVGQVCIMIHSGSRGLGHQVATDALTAMERAMARDNIPTNDRQLACALISSQEGQVPNLPVLVM